ncbi:hypothetical protein CHELA1G11_10230 [Hyphomicrobiales bacterium]|nr:hypothetical protein CHELA1G11_10230 [Hyphomicrobiales bacterium]CAH1676145.1 hypothetical protein CHELA1G2_14077 [Hyphomicrobiales bacterium]
MAGHGKAVAVRIAAMHLSPAYGLGSPPDGEGAARWHAVIGGDGSLEEKRRPLFARRLR